MLEETGSLVAVTDENAGLMCNKKNEAGTDENQQREEGRKSVREPQGDVRNDNLKAVVSFLSNQNRLVSELARKLKEATGKVRPRKLIALFLNRIYT